MQRANLLRLAGASLMAIAVILWFLVSFQSRQTAASQFFFVIYSDAPGNLADPVLTLRNGGNAVELRLFANATTHVRVVVRADAACSASAAQSGDLRVSDLTLSPNAVTAIECSTNRPPRFVSFVRREAVAGMLRPATIPEELVRTMSPAHQIRVAVASDTFGAGSFNGGLDDPVVQMRVRMPDSPEQTNQRYLSRFGAGYQPAVVIQWSDRRAELFWALGLALVGVLSVLCANALYALLTVT